MTRPNYGIGGTLTARDHYAIGPSAIVIAACVIVVAVAFLAGLGIGGSIAPADPAEVAALKARNKALAQEVTRQNTLISDSILLDSLHDTESAPATDTPLLREQSRRQVVPAGKRPRLRLASFVTTTPTAYPVPRLIGKRYHKRMGHFRVKVTSYKLTPVRRRANRIIRQTPKPGTRLPEGATIRVRIWRYVGKPRYIRSRIRFWLAYYKVRRRDGRSRGWWLNKGMDICRKESGYRTSAHSPSGHHHGIFQQTIGEWRTLRRLHTYDWPCRFFAKQVADGGVRVVSHQYATW